MDRHCPASVSAQELELVEGEEKEAAGDRKASSKIRAVISFLQQNIVQNLGDQSN